MQTPTLHVDRRQRDKMRDAAQALLLELGGHVASVGYALGREAPHRYDEQLADDIRDLLRTPFTRPDALRSLRGWRVSAACCALQCDARGSSVSCASAPELAPCRPTLSTRSVSRLVLLPYQCYSMTGTSLSPTGAGGRHHRLHASVDWMDICGEGPIGRGDRAKRTRDNPAGAAVSSCTPVPLNYACTTLA